MNDVAGFIGPEVFRTREQLVRCCPEDIAMGKLHGLTIGLDICPTHHMAVTLGDLDWCQDQIMPANPAYLIALPTKQERPHAELSRHIFPGSRPAAGEIRLPVNNAMWNFYKRIGAVDANDKYTENFGESLWVYFQYCRARGDNRSRDAVYPEGRKKIEEVEARGVDLATGHGKNIWDLNPDLEAKLKSPYENAKLCLRAEFNPDFTKTIPNAVFVKTLSKDRDDHISHPDTGEKLSPESIKILEKLRESWGGPNPPGGRSSYRMVSMPRPSWTRDTSRLTWR